METIQTEAGTVGGTTPSVMLKRKRTPDQDATPQQQHHVQQPQHHVHHHHDPHQHPQQPHHAAAPPPAKAAKTHNHLQINYLARQNKDDLALASTQDSMPDVVDLLNQYQGVLERHESLACNLGARPLGPILIKRFERLFDGPPKVLKSHGKEGANITWLDVVEFARNKPEQFTLGQMSEGRKVCQFYTKQCRVQISEEDYVLISSGIPQKMIPPQPIVEDEEKELGTLEILEERLEKICRLADQVAARARQLNHRIRGRKQAILDRRATEPSFRPLSPSNVALANGSAQSSTPSFVAVNSRLPDANGSEYSKIGASPATRKELTDRFSSLSERRTSSALSEAVRQRDSISGLPGANLMGASSHASTEQDLTALLMAQNNPQNQHQPSYGGSANVSGPTTPSAVPSSYFHHHNGSSAHQPAPLGSNVATPHMHAANAPRPHPQSNQSHHQHHQSIEKEKPDDGPFKGEMVSRMESLGKGERVIPPCDRCRRLHMDCLKNLTACVGCTRKHAKCSWRDVREDEVLRSASVMRPQHVTNDSYHGMPVDPAMHSPPLFDQHYKQPTAATAHTPNFGGHNYEQATSTGTRDDSGSEHAEGVSRGSTNIAEAEAAFTAAQRARGSSTASGPPAASVEDKQRANEPERPGRAQFLESLSKYTPTYGRTAPPSYDGPSQYTTQRHDTPDRSHEMPTTAPEQDPAIKADNTDTNMTGIDTDHVQMIRQRILRAQQDSPDQHGRKTEDHQPPAPEQRVISSDVTHNRVWSDDHPGSHTAGAAADQHNSNSSSTSGTAVVHAAAEPHRDPSNGVQPAQSGAAATPAPAASAAE